MIELVFVVVACAGIAGVARRRGSRGWPFVVVAAGGALLVSAIGVAAFGSGPDILLRWAWIGLWYLATFRLTGGGRRLAETWQCPECRPVQRADDARLSLRLSGSPESWK